MKVNFAVSLSGLMGSKSGVWAERLLVMLPSADVHAPIITRRGVFYLGRLCASGDEGLQNARAHFIDAFFVGRQWQDDRDDLPRDDNEAVTKHQDNYANFFKLAVFQHQAK